MTVLSKEVIRKRLADRSLIISPLLDPVVQIGQMSVDLRIGTSAALVRASDLSHVDPALYLPNKNGGYASEKSRRRKLERVSVKFGQKLILHAGSLILVSTYEWVKLPADLKGVVTARSSWAREGLSIATATFVDPCYNGSITLELANLGQIPIALYPGMRVAQIALYRVERDTKRSKCTQDISQFSGSFEPNAGDIANNDRRFIPVERR